MTSILEFEAKEMELQLYEPYAMLSPNFLRSAYENVVVKWGARLYLAARWRFAEPPDICSALTGTPAAFWEKHPEECSKRISRDFSSDLVIAENLFLLSAMFAIAWRFACRR
jgi:hypothetical protein